VQVADIEHSNRPAYYITPYSMNTYYLQRKNTPSEAL